MTFRNAQQARILIGTLAAAAYARSVDIESPTDMYDVTTLADTTKQFIPGLTDGGTFNIAGPLDVDSGAAGQFASIAALKSATTATPITYLPLGTDGAIWLASAWEVAMQTMNGVAATVDWSMSAQISGQVDFNGQLLENGTTVTVDTNGTALDNGAGTSNGLVANLHVTAFSGFTSNAIRIEHSTNNSVWATLASFTTATATTSERISVTGTVNRYLRVVDDVTGAGTCTRTVAICRR